MNIVVIGNSVVATNVLTWLRKLNSRVNLFLIYDNNLPIGFVQQLVPYYSCGYLDRREIVVHSEAYVKEILRVDTIGASYDEIKIDDKDKRVKVGNKEIYFDKLILALDFKPYIPPCLKNYKEVLQINMFDLSKSELLRSKLEESPNICIIGDLLYGLLMRSLLEKKGFRADIYYEERGIDEDIFNFMIKKLGRSDIKKIDLNYIKSKQYDVIIWCGYWKTYEFPFLTLTRGSLGYIVRSDMSINNDIFLVGVSELTGVLGAKYLPVSISLHLTEGLVAAHNALREPKLRINSMLGFIYVPLNNYIIFRCGAIADELESKKIIVSKIRDNLDNILSEELGEVMIKIIADKYAKRILGVQGVIQKCASLYMNYVLSLMQMSTNLNDLITRILTPSFTELMSIDPMQKLISALWYKSIWSR